MTFLGVASFFEGKKKERGYILAADSGMGMANSLDEVTVGMRPEPVARVEKYFWGEDHIGLVAGALVLPALGEPAEVYKRAMSSLNGVFDGVESGRMYSGLPAFRFTKGVFIVIAKRRAGGVDLFSLREDGRQRSKFSARREDKEDVKRGAGLVLRGGPMNGNLEVFGQTLNSANFSQGHDALSEFMETDKVEEALRYDPRPIHYYAISPSRFGRVEGGRVIPLEKD